MNPNLALMQTLYGRGSRELGTELTEVLLAFPTAAAEIDLLLDQDAIAAMDKLDRLIERFEGGKRLAALCRNAIVRERELQPPSTAA